MKLPFSFLLAAALTPLAMSGATCDDLANVIAPDMAVTSATMVAAGPAPGRGRGPAANLPAYCRVQAVSRPVADSEIHFEVWLPSPETWNGKFEGTGNGGYSSAMTTADMVQGLTRGFAVAGSDTGHSGGDLKFGAGHIEKINDWGYRAVHVMTDNAKLLVRDYYGRFPKYSYFTGCSTGGHQALSEAQRYPGDYDGIVAGDPGNDRVHLNVNFLWAYTALYKEAGNDIPAAKLPLITKAAMKSCDAADGMEDGIIADPRSCKFDPATLVCHGADDGSCLTKAQADAVKKIYGGPMNPRTGRNIMPGFPIGSESGWTGYFVGQKEPARVDFWRLWVFGNPLWDWRNFDFDRDVAFADTKLAAVNSVDEDLRPFQKLGGKLLMYQGWADPVVPPESTILYYDKVLEKAAGSKSAGDFVRLFMAPGMGHCGGGVGPNTFDSLSALDHWVDGGAVPAKIVASHATAGQVDRTRPLCPYPQTARWNGTGSRDDEANFSCVAPATSGAGRAGKPTAAAKGKTK